MKIERLSLRIGIFAACMGTFMVICLVSLITLLESCEYTEIESAKVSEYNKLKEDLAHLVKQNMNDSDINALKVEVENLRAKLSRVKKENASYHAELARRRNAEAAKQAAKAKLDEDFELQFSLWNGSHRKTVEYVKEHMHNPKSFKHVETHYIDYAEKDYRIIQMKYRGTNLFNAVVTNSIWVKIDLHGNVFEVIKNQ